MSTPTVNAPPSALAPDGLPWPEGYFDGPVKITLEQAIEAHGIRPSVYKRGRPVWQLHELQNPNYTSTLPEEPPELVAKWTREANQK
jgi:hypothetical protein